MRNLHHSRAAREREQRSAVSVFPAGLPAHILELLHAEGVHDLHDWRRLGKRRLRIFGIVPSVVRILDTAVREAHQ